MPKQAELACLLHHRGVRGNRFLGWRRHVGGDFVDQRRNMVEQLLGWKHFVGRDGQQIAQARQPTC
jgi:hypothetical protein